MKRYTAMDFIYFNIFTFVTALVSLILLQPTSTNAAHYISKNHYITAKSSPGGNASLPKSTRSRTECILKCKNKQGGNLQPFYSAQNECFCLNDDKHEGETLTKEKFDKIDGWLLLMVSSLDKIISGLQIFDRAAPTNKI